ncbi:MAG TPA: PAS domain-containing sensor histidine kinase [Acidimicrobiales bacterium]|nr:PAS domain-containing sensor histidine kinase [Acidimicrobiales bacterium]
MTNEDGQALTGRVLGALSALVPLGIIATDADGNIWYHNQRWENLTGIPWSKQKGQPWYGCVHPDDVDRVAAQWRQGRTRRGHFGPFRTVAVENAAVTECMAEATPVQAADGTLSGFVLTVSNATSPERFPTLTGPHLVERLLDRSEDFVTILNADGSWRWSSAGALRLVGNWMEYDPADGVLPYVHPDDVPMVEEAFVRIVEGRWTPGERLEVRVRAADGSWRDMEALVDVLLDDPDVRGLVVHARDVTEQRALLEQLATVDRRRTEAMATVTHELRNPLTSITGFAELLRDTLDPLADREQIDYVDTILRNARQVMRLSGDLVDLEHLAAGTVALSVGPVDVADCLRRAGHAAEPLARQKGLSLHLEVDDGPELAGDGERLGQLFDNLLSNAVKFTPEGGQVTLRGKPVAEGWRVEVADTGMGIPEEDVPQLFTQFFRGANARSGGLEGRGLGLSIAKAIVDLHHGEIDVTSALGAGTTFTVLLRGAEEGAGRPGPGR